ncbi:MAG: HD domain-containing phosphohydrolase [Planctomycetota bacterium]
MDTVTAPLAQLLDALHCGAALVDRRGVFVHVNPRLAAMHGRPADQLVGRPVADAYPSEDGKRRLAELTADFDREAEGEFFVEPPENERLPVVFASRPLASDHGGRAELLVVTVIEIAQQKQDLDQIAELTDTVLEQALHLRGENTVLEALVAERTADLKEANMSALTMLAIASEARDEDTGAHVKRIEHYTRAVAVEMGLSEKDAERFGYSSILHDVGKIHVPDHILKKPGPLTGDERHEMQQHTVIGQRILSDNPFFDDARLIARHHHENYDGSGYPDRLAGEDIPLAARIVHVVDVFDALASSRVYKKAWPPEKARAMIAENAGKAFDPDAAAAFLSLLDRGQVQPA